MNFEQVISTKKFSKYYQEEGKNSKVLAQAVSAHGTFLTGSLHPRFFSQDFFKIFCCAFIEELSVFGKR